MCCACNHKVIFTINKIDEITYLIFNSTSREDKLYVGRPRYTYFLFKTEPTKKKLAE